MSNTNTNKIHSQFFLSLSPNTENISIKLEKSAYTSNTYTDASWGRLSYQTHLETKLNVIGTVLDVPVKINYMQ